MYAGTESEVYTELVGYINMVIWARILAISLHVFTFSKEKPGLQIRNQSFDYFYERCKGGVVYNVIINYLLVDFPNLSNNNMVLPRIKCLKQLLICASYVRSVVFTLTQMNSH